MWAVAAVISTLAVAVKAAYLAPEQIHINYGSDPMTTMMVTFNTVGQPADAWVEYGTSATRHLRTASKVARATSTEFDQPQQWVNRVSITGLSPASEYWYRCVAKNGSTTEESQLFAFKTAGSTEAWRPRLAIWGDLGIVNDRSIPSLTRDARSGFVDVNLHVGDIAYNLQNQWQGGPAGSRGDAFMRLAQNYSATVPTHFCPGNHEDYADLKQYRARMSMPGYEETSSMYHSMDLGIVHVVMFSSEAYFYPTAHGMGMLKQQYEWLEKDLAAANANRAQVPWIVTMAHRPMYCSANDDADDCHHIYSLFRDGIAGKYATEPLLKKYGVDMHIGAHEHSYSRSWPMYAGKPVKQADFNVYRNFNETVHVISGAAGCQENQSIWKDKRSDWVATEANVYGYGYLRAANGTHMNWQFLDVDNSTIVDDLTLVKSYHGPW